MKCNLLDPNRGGLESLQECRVKPKSGFVKSKLENGVLRAAKRLGLRFSRHRILLIRKHIPIKKRVMLRNPHLAYSVYGTIP